MMNSKSKDAVIRKQVHSVQFGFYTDAQVRERSVVEVTSALTFDPNGSPLCGGLYDSRLGAYSHQDRSCATCALNSLDCPGHFGHLELAVPCYHPILFRDVIALLKLKCFRCHRLMAQPHQLDVYRVKFYLLYLNRMSELFDLDHALAGASSRAKNRAAAEQQQQQSYLHPTALAKIGVTGMGEVLSRYQAEFSQQQQQQRRGRQQQPPPTLTSYQREVRKQLVAELVGFCKAKSCPHCGAASPSKVRGDASNKVFVKYTAAARRLNRLERQHETMESALAIAENENSNHKRGATRDSRRSGGSAVSDGNDSEDTEPENLDDDDSADGSNEDQTLSGDGDNKTRDTPEDEDDDDDELDEPSSGATKDGEKYMHPGEVQAQLRRTWELHPFLCNCLFGSDDVFADNSHGCGDSGSDGSPARSGLDKYFLRAVPVPPSRFRPPMQLGSLSVEHAQTQYLGKILQLNNALRTHLKEAKEGSGSSSSYSSSSKAYTTWMELQTAVNCFIDSSKDPSAGPNNPPPPGIRQILERKEGLFRKNMMGKRVDFACRSVISPDPFIGTNEIGLPRYFATVLTFPTPVTDWNAQRMRALVERGADSYPGARWVEMNGRRVDLTKMTRFKREALAANLLSSLKTGTPAVVGRQLTDGDYVLMNRQPTLHKPGIMAHRVRILHNPTQKTIRMHYANCNTYNADYDGDEMNCHFPQSELARAEAVHIARTDYQYIVPTDGTPLRGLIQDHVVGGVKLTKRDTFLEKWEYQQLLFAALSSLNGLEVVPHEVDIEMFPPAILQPRRLWTGKQVVSTLLFHLCRTNSHQRDNSLSKSFGLSLERKAKTPETAFGPMQEEHLVLIRDGELLRGVLDKSAFGATDFSLVHGIYESYGPEKAGILLNALGRLFTAYIQYFAGHSCRMEDLVLTDRADRERRVLVERSYNQGTRAAKAWADSDGGKTAISQVGNQPNAGDALHPVEATSTAQKIAALLSGTEGKQNHAALDAYMQSQLNPLSSNIVKQCLPNGLSVPFPYNSFSIMTVTGAKGSIVNQSQVSCALGQQALEGRRVPRMSSGRTLPSFAPFDPNPRADGFVLDRFLTGVRPQEYYFHCMAGREGLVDTAVKTSRSGYLQRCLVKHLEELKISYDFTVRNAEGGVVQFLYGEDGLDPTKASYLDCTDKSFDFLARNHHALSCRNTALPNSSIEKANAVALGSNLASQEIGEFPYEGARVFARRLRFGNVWERGSLCQGWHKATIIKVHKHGKTVDLRYNDESQVVARVPIVIDLGDTRQSLETRTLSTVATIVKPAYEDPVLCSGNPEFQVGVNGACVSERVALATHQAMESASNRAMMAKSGITRDDMSRLVSAKYSCSLCPPGEAVGCIAAQSVGEPSTQMTLNTFHLAGSGANVTLGIPRLREIIMTASREPKTPTMSVPLHNYVSDAEATRLTRRLTKLNLMELIASVKGVQVNETIECLRGDDWTRNYYVTIKLHPAKRIQEAFGLSIRMVAAVVAKSFVPMLAKIMSAELRRSFADGEILGGESSDYVSEDDHALEEQEGALQDMEDQQEMQQSGEEERDEDAPNEEDGADASKYRQRSDSASYDDEGDENDDEVFDDAGERVKRSQAFGNEVSQDQFTLMKTPSNDHSSPVVNERTSMISLQPLSVDPASPPLLMVDLVERAASATLLRSVKGIQEAFVIDEEDRGRCLQTTGVNFEQIWKLDNVDHDRLISNDIWAVRCAYGVEAARTSIVSQITSVFGAYGITVDPRHLSLIADYMTFDGGYKPLSRTGMESSSSPLLQMSFETTVNFLKNAAVLGLSDDLRSPSGNLVMGRPVCHGTGAFELLAGASRW